MNYVLADAHAPEEQYDIFFNPESPKDLEKDDTVIYVEFRDFATCMDWLWKQEHTASLLFRNGDMGLEKNDFCYYFASTAGLTSFMFTDYEIPPNLNYRPPGRNSKGGESPRIELRGAMGVGTWGIRGRKPPPTSRCSTPRWEDPPASSPCKKKHHEHLTCHRQSRHLDHHVLLRGADSGAG